MSGKRESTKITQKRREILIKPAENADFCSKGVTTSTRSNQLSTDIGPSSEGAQMDPEKARKPYKTLQKLRILIQKGVNLDPLQPDPGILSRYLFFFRPFIFI